MANLEIERSLKVIEWEMIFSQQYAVSGKLQQISHPQSAL
jgi:hypothetical protein